MRNMDTQSILKRVNEFIKKFPVGVLSTLEDGKLRSRMFQCVGCDGQKFYFCTGKHKPVYKQLQKTPEASFCSFRPNYSHVITVSGTVTFFEDLKMKEKILTDHPAIRGIYKKADNPDFALFQMTADDAERFTFAEGTVKAWFTKKKPAVFLKNKEKWA